MTKRKPGGKTSKPGPDPERLVIEGDPEEALGRLLVRRGKPGEWHEFAEGIVPDDRRAVEYEFEGGERYRFAAGELESKLGKSSLKKVREPVRWRYLDD